MPRYSTVRERIFWEYAKLMAASATDGPSDPDHYWRFVNYAYGRLCSSEITPSSVIRENRKLVLSETVCAYCGAAGDLQWEHIIPRSAGGPDTIDNQVLACGPCNRRKGSMDLLAFYEGRRNAIPPLVMAKYLKVLLQALGDAGVLNEPSFPPGSRLSLGALHAVFRR